MSGYEMRVYQVASGKIGDLQAVMREVMLPLMGEYGMEAIAFFATPDDSEVRWYVRHASEEAIGSDWDRFHADPRWKAAMAERTRGTPFITGETSAPVRGIAGLPPLREEANLAVVGAYAKGLFADRDAAAVDRYAAPDMVNHNPEAPPGPEGVKGFIAHFFGRYPEAAAEARRMAAAGELVFVHSLLKTGPDDRGSAVADIFRLKDGRIAEHWDVMQAIPERTTSGETMI